MNTEYVYRLNDGQLISQIANITNASPSRFGLNFLSKSIDGEIKEHYSTIESRDKLDLLPEGVKAFAESSIKNDDWFLMAFVSITPDEEYNSLYWIFNEKINRDGVTDEFRLLLDSSLDPSLADLKCKIFKVDLDMSKIDFYVGENMLSGDEVDAVARQIESALESSGKGNIALSFRNTVSKFDKKFVVSILYRHKATTGEDLLYISSAEVK